MAFDAGLFSFRDFRLNTKSKSKNELFVLITNPKDVQFKASAQREPLARMRYSTHVRALIFAKHLILSAKVYVDGELIGSAFRVQPNKPLFVCKWEAAKYRRGTHKLVLVVQDANNNVEIVSQQFSLNAATLKDFGLFQNFILLGDQIAFVNIYLTNYIT